MTVGKSLSVEVGPAVVADEGGNEECKVIYGY
jgi:hypothetical protein